MITTPPHKRAHSQILRKIAYLRYLAHTHRKTTGPNLNRLAFSLESLCDCHPGMERILDDVLAVDQEVKTKVVPATV
jgi:hypothetical protein